jgi:DNA-binding transcriptional LysR family regulator
MGVRGRVTNIPTDLLRTFVTVVDQRGFTRAARLLGLSQPAVSAHIKRLQTMLESELFDRSGPGLALTPTGEAIVEHARHLLSINDLIVQAAEPGPSARTIRVGVPVDFLGGNLPGLLAGFRECRSGLRFRVHHGVLEAQVNELRQGRLDIAVGVSLASPIGGARHHWAEQTVWVRGRSTHVSPAAPVQLVSLGETCVYHRAAVAALQQAHRDSEVVFIGPTIVSAAAAIRAGLGIMALPRSRVWPPDLIIWEDAPLPNLPDLVWGVYLREGGEREPLERIADTIARELRARSEMAVSASPPRNRTTGRVLARQVAIN